MLHYIARSYYIVECNPKGNGTFGGRWYNLTHLRDSINRTGIHFFNHAKTPKPEYSDVN